MLFQLPLPATVNEAVFTRLVHVRRDGRESIGATQSNTQVELLRYQVPRAWHGYLIGYQNEVLDSAYTYSGSLVWRILAGGAGFDADGGSDFTELRGTRTVLGDALTYLQAGSEVIMLVRRAVTAGGAQTCTASFSMLFWPTTIEKTFFRKATP